MEDAARNEMEDRPLITDDHRMASVVAALVPNYDVGMLGKNVNDLTLTFVPPLDANDDNGWHVVSWCGGPNAGGLIAPPLLSS